jgi:glutamate synthase (NADPH/NADH)
MNYNFKFKLNLNFMQILEDAETLASRMIHRGACGCDNDTGDGAGVVTAIPHEFYRRILK